MSKKKTKWRTYEEVAHQVLNDVRDELGIDVFEGKQVVEGQCTKWEIDGKGVCHGDETFFLVECRRYTTSHLKQEHVGALAYRISDTGATGGFIVCPLELQEGAKKVAESENIKTIHLDPRSTPELYIARFLDQIRIGITETYNLSKNVSEHVSVFYVDKDGNHFTPDEMEKHRQEGKL